MFVRAEHSLVRYRLPPSVIALIFFVISTLLFTYPLVAHSSTHVLGWNKLDSYKILWLFRWVPHALFDLGTSPWFVPNIYYPYRYHLVSGEVTSLHSFGQLTLTMLVGEIVI